MAGRCGVSCSAASTACPSSSGCTVAQQHVGAGGGDDVYSLPAVAGFAGDFDSVLAEAGSTARPGRRGVVGDHHRIVMARHPDGGAPRAAPGCAVDFHRAASRRPGRVMWVSPERRAGAGTSRCRCRGRRARLPVLAVIDTASRRACLPDGVRGGLLGDAQQGVLDGRDGDVVQAGVDGDAEPVVVGAQDFLRPVRARRRPGWPGAGSIRSVCMSRSASR